MLKTIDRATLAASVAHEANRAYCAQLGDLSQLPWEQAPEWQRASAIAGVHGVLAGNTPEQSHESWMAVKAEAGWVYGEVKDAEAKTHPCMRPYGELPTEQRVKDLLFVGVVRAVLDAMPLQTITFDVGADGATAR